MKRGITIVVAAVALSVTAEGWFVYHAMTRSPGRALASAPAAAAPSQHVQVVNGETAVILGADAQRASHIDTIPVAAVALRPESTVYATVIDLQPLFDLGSRRAAARADRESARAQVDTSRPQYERNRLLFESDRDVSQKTLQLSRAVMRTDQAKLHSAEVAESSVEATLRQQFGDTLANAADSPGSDLFQRLSTGRAVVLRVTLPANEAGSAPMQITIDDPGGRSFPARKLSASPQSDPLIQGTPFFYVTDPALPVGMRATAHVPSGGKPTPGLRIPESAVVWYGGQRWVYVRTSADRFTRRYLPEAPSIDRGFIVTSGFREGDEVVINGAQLLLSEELLPQAIATQCKDPPECDD